MVPFNIIIRLSVLLFSIFLVVDTGYGQSKVNSFFKPSDTLNIPRRNSVIVFESIVFVGGIIGACMCSTCHKGKCNKDKMECSRGGMKGDCSKSSCEKDEMECHKGMGKSHCKKEGECSEIVIESNDGEKVIKKVKIIKTM